MKDWWDYIKIKNVYLRRLYNQIQGYTIDFKTVETYITEHYVVSKICNSCKSIRKRQNITEKRAKGIACEIIPHTYRRQRYSVWGTIYKKGISEEDHWGPLEAGYYTHKIVFFFIWHTVNIISFKIVLCSVLITHMCIKNIKTQTRIFNPSRTEVISGEKGMESKGNKISFKCI